MLALHNLKKSKGQYISFGIIICLTALIMNIALVLADQTSAAYDKRFDELNTAEINVMIPAVLDNDDISGKLTGISGVKLSERHHGVLVSAAVHEFQDSDFDMNTVFYDLGEARSVNKLEISGGGSSDAIYIPAYIKELGGYTVGENIVYSIDGEDYTFKIGGTVEEMQFGNYGTGLIGAYLPRELYEKFIEDKTEIAEYSLKTVSGADLAGIKRDISDLLSDENIPALGITDADSGKQSRSMVCSLLIAIFLALAAIILVVSIFLSNFKIRNTIEAEMTEMGVLKALGYTSPMIISGSVIPYTLVGLTATVLGAACSYAVLPSIATVLAIQSGFSFSPSFDPLALIITIIVPTAAILLFAYLAAQKIRRYEPINAIRGITGTASDKNRFPLETTKTPAKLTLIIKQIASSAGQNILLFAVSFGIMVLMSFAGTLVYNVNIEPSNFMDTLQEETPSVIFQSDDIDGLKEKLGGDSRVELALGYASTRVSYTDGSLTAFVCEDFSKVTNGICYEGRDPESADEAAAGSALAEKYRIGDRIELKSGDKTQSFTITGFVQSVNNGGEVCELTDAGYARLSEKEPGSLNVYLKEKGAEAFIKEYEDKYGDMITSSLNYEKLNESGTRMYAGIVSAVTIIILIISTLVVLLVMYVIINSLLTRRRQEFGIYKAIGWSSRQLILQNAAGFLPSVALASVLSAVMGLMYLPAMNSAIFELLGAYKNHFVIPLWFLLIFAAIFIAICFIISVLLALPIKKITAYSLLKE